jgi:DNA-binding NarL/FixJ family response regulator
MARRSPASDRIDRILVVEDLPDARTWLQDAAIEAFPDATVTGVATLAEALEALERTPPDLALVDLGLPDGSGHDGHLFSALRAGAQGYVLKDRSRESLADMLRGIVEGQPPLSPTIARRLLGHFHEPDSADAGLTARERDVLTLLAKGLTVAAVADMLGITANTASGYVKNVYRKLNVSCRAEATLEAARRGLIRLH